MLIKNEYKPSMLPKAAKAKKPITSDGRISLVLWLIAAAFVGLLVFINFKCLVSKVNTYYFIL